MYQINDIMRAESNQTDQESEDHIGKPLPSPHDMGLEIS